MYGDLVICGRDDARTILQGEQGQSYFQNIISFGGSREPMPVFVEAHPAPRKLYVACDDVSWPSPIAERMGYLQPTRADVSRLLAFCETVEGHVLLHCAEGKSRSTAAALVLMVLQQGPGSEQRAVEHLLQIRPVAEPNAIIIALADEMMGREGALIDAFEARWEDCPNPSHLC